MLAPLLMLKEFFEILQVFVPLIILKVFFEIRSGDKISFSWLNFLY